MGKTSIEWTDHSINPFRARNRDTGQVGHFCVKISPGCKYCYSSRLQSRFGTFPFVVENRDKVELFLDESKLQDVLRRKIPTKYFWCDMTDMFLEDYPDEWIDPCFATMALTPWHTHQVLTKRAARMQKYFADLHRLGSDRVMAIRTKTPDYIAFVQDKASPIHFPLPNTWLGVSVEDQQRADERIPLLLQTPAAVRFVSYEPALGPVDFTRLYGKITWRTGPEPGDAWVDLCVDSLGGKCTAAWCGRKSIPDRPLPAHLDWVIAGGESGPEARAAHSDWIRGVRDQCVAARVPFFFKQWGQWARWSPNLPAGDVIHVATDGAYGESASSAGYVRRGGSIVSDSTTEPLVPIGKKAAGRLLDGREWSEFPKQAWVGGELRQ
jgi:protein gp37